jgi:hypothetical protein
LLLARKVHSARQEGATAALVVHVLQLAGAADVFQT